MRIIPQGVITPTAEGFYHELLKHLNSQNASANLSAPEGLSVSTQNGTMQQI